MQTTDKETHGAEIGQVQAENDRLRRALEEIRDYGTTADVAGDAHGNIVEGPPRMNVQAKMAYKALLKRVI